MKKQVQVFLNEDDEALLSRSITCHVPGVHFLNDNVWAQYPDIKEDLHLCDSGRVYLFDGDINDLPLRCRADGRIEGPISGCVIQFLRCRREGTLLLSGRLAVGFDRHDTNMKRFASRVFDCLKSISLVGVTNPEGHIDEHYCVGQDTRRAVEANELQLADRGTRLRFALHF